MFFVAQNPPPPPPIAIAAEIRTVEPRLRTTVPLRVPAAAAPTRVRSRVDIRSRHYDPRYLTPQERIVRQGKFSGGPPAVCTATVCAQSVWEQLGRQDIRDPFQRP